MKMMHSNNRRNPASGFTLVELMVVVAIIGILAAVAGPRVQAFRAKGVQAEAKSNLHSFYLAMISFEDANDRFPDGQGACVDNQPCAIGADQITFRQTADSKYRYGSSSEPEGFLAGARSRRPLLNGIFDAWAVNTNKVLCSQRDATSPLDEAAQNAGAGLTSSCGRARQATVDIGDNGQPTTAPATGANGVDAKQ